MFILTNTNIEPASKKAGSVKNIERIKTDKLGVVKYKRGHYFIIYKSKDYIPIFDAGYCPKILFSTPLNDFWEIGKPSRKTKVTAISYLSEYWNILYDGMKVSIINNNVEFKTVTLDMNYLEIKAELALV